MAPASAVIEAGKMKNTLTAFKCGWVHFELTSHCNLACVYCAVSQPWYQGEDMQLEKASAITQWLLRNKVAKVNLNGHGETTILRGWPQIVAPLLRSKTQCYLITNASKSFSDEELDALSRMSGITISCDTFESALHAQLRRKSQLRAVLQAIAAIRRTARKNQIPPPPIILSCVLGAENSDSLEEFLLFAMCMDIHCVQLCSLTEYPLPAGAEIKMNPLSTLSQSRLVRLKRVLESHAQVCEAASAEAAGMTLAIHPGILEEINSALALSVVAPG